MKMTLEDIKKKLYKEYDVKMSIDDPALMIYKIHSELTDSILSATATAERNNRSLGNINLKMVLGASGGALIVGLLGGVLLTNLFSNKSQKIETVATVAQEKEVETPAPAFSVTDEESCGDYKKTVMSLTKTLTTYRDAENNYKNLIMQYQKKILPENYYKFEAENGKRHFIGIQENDKRYSAYKGEDGIITHFIEYY